MAGSPKTYNVRVFYVENEEERDQCQFVYPPVNGDKPTRCKRDGIYRIGEVIFLCGLHMPGVGRHPVSNPISTEKMKSPLQSRDKSMFARMQRFFEANPGKVISYRQIMDMFPNMKSRDYISIIVCRLRKEREMRILNVTGIGYKYIGNAEELRIEEYNRV